MLMVIKTMEQEGDKKRKRKKKRQKKKIVVVDLMIWKGRRLRMEDWEGLDMMNYIYVYAQSRCTKLLSVGKLASNKCRS